MENINCSSCQQEVDQILALSCDHNLCLICSAKQLPDVGNILTCQICQEQTELDLQSIEILRNQEGTQLNNTQSYYGGQIGNEVLSQETSLFCYTCETPCFTVEQYINGMHKGCEVKCIQKHYDSLRGRIENISALLSTKSDNILNDEHLISQKKNELIDTVNQTKCMIKQNLDQLVNFLLQKQQDMLDQTDELLQDKIGDLDKVLNKLKQYQNITHDYLQNIQNLYYRKNRNLQSDIQVFNYYSNNKNQIINKIKDMEENLNTLVSNETQINYTIDQYEQVQQIQNIKVLVEGQKGLQIQINPNKSYQNIQNIPQEKIYHLQRTNLSPRQPKNKIDYLLKQQRKATQSKIKELKSSTILPQCETKPFQPTSSIPTFASPNQRITMYQDNLDQVLREDINDKRVNNISNVSSFKDFPRKNSIYSQYDLQEDSIVQQMKASISNIRNNIRSTAKKTNLNPLNIKSGNIQPAKFLSKKSPRDNSQDSANKLANNAKAQNYDILNSTVLNRKINQVKNQNSCVSDRGELFSKRENSINNNNKQSSGTFEKFQFNLQKEKENSALNNNSLFDRVLRKQQLF